MRLRLARALVRNRKFYGLVIGGSAQSIGKIDAGALCLRELAKGIWMRSTIFGLLLAAVVSLWPSLVSAKVFGHYGGWSVIRDENSCAMGAAFEGPGNTLVLLTRFVDDDLWLTIKNRNWSTQKGKEYRVSYRLNDERYSATAFGDRDEDGGALRTNFDLEFLADFALGDGLEIFLDGEKIESISLKGTLAATGGLNACVKTVWSGLSREEKDRIRFADIAKDPFASGTTTDLQKGVGGPVPPAPKGIYEWATRIQENYPSQALREGLEGTVGIRLTVSRIGRATDCIVTYSSGHTILDDSACSNAIRYSRFEPARDVNGDSTIGTYETRLTYRLNQ